MEDVVNFFRSIWGVWLMAIFIGIVVWVMWPGRRGEIERHANIPLDDDPPSEMPSGRGPADGRKWGN